MTKITLKEKQIETSLEELKNYIGTTADVARKWFEQESPEIKKRQFKQKGGLNDKKKGAVYVYFDKNRQVLYVGETGGGVKERTHFKTARHTETEWWPKWQRVRFMSMVDRTSRLTLEMLLILAYQPPYNKKPEARKIEELFS